MVDIKTGDLESGEKRLRASGKVVPEAEEKARSKSSAPPPPSTTSTTTTPATTPYPQPRLSVDLSTLNQHALPATIRGDESDDDDAAAASASGTTIKKKPIRKLKAFKRHLLHPRTKRQKAVCGVFWIVLIAAAVCFLIWGLPPLTKKVLVPILERVKEKMSKPAITAMSFFAITLLPMLFIPFRPFIWILSYAIGAGPAFGVVTAATAVGMTLQFFLSKTLLRERAAKWSQKATWSATLMETVKEAGPFKTVLILRLGPVPYSLLSYCLPLSPDISYLKYIVASVIGHAPDDAMHVFLGASFEGIGSIVKGEKPTPQKLASVAVPLVAAIAVCIGGTIYGKRAYAKVRAARAEHAAEEAAEEALGGGGGSSGGGGGGGEGRAAAGSSSSSAVVVPAATATTTANGASHPAGAASHYLNGDVEMAIKK